MHPVPKTPVITMISFILPYCRGTTITLKLSPNLRIKTKAPKKTVPVDPHALEVQKLDRLLSLVRELPEGELVKETVSTVASN